MTPPELILLFIFGSIALVWGMLLQLEKHYNNMAKTLNRQADILRQLAEHQVSFAKEVRLRQGSEEAIREVLKKEKAKWPSHLKIIDPDYDPEPEIKI